MARDPRVRRAQLAAGIIVGVIVGTIHALVTHVASPPVEPAAAVLQMPFGSGAHGHGDTH